MLRCISITAAAMLAVAPTAGADTMPGPGSSPSAERAMLTPEYAEGRRDRKTWEDWFNGLVIGSYRDGAFWWFGERTKDTPRPCTSPSGDAGWVAGCRAAQRRLALSDIRWKTEASYALGWESAVATDIPPEPITMTESEKARSMTAAYVDGSRDRQAWEEWLRKLPIGSYRDGAFWWLDEHDKNSPKPCASPARNAQWVAGCRAAQGRLAEPDVRRTTEVDYRTGWNSEPSAAPSQ